MLMVSMINLLKVQVVVKEFIGGEIVLLHAPGSRSKNRSIQTQGLLIKSWLASKYPREYL